MRSQPPTSLELKPSENGNPKLRLRDPGTTNAPRVPLVQRVGRPLPLIGALLVLVALAGYWSVYSQTTKRTPVLVAAHELQAGTTIRPSDLRTVELAGDAGTIAALVPERELGSVLGSDLAVTVAEGVPLARAAVASAGAAPAAMTLVVPALRALPGSLRPGDRVTVLATFEHGTGARARAVARGLRVLSVGVAPEGLDRASASLPVTVALTDPSLAAGLALANSEGSIDLVREGTRGRTAPIPPANENGGS